MPQVVRIHEVLSPNQLERDEWYLVRDPSGRRCVLFESFVIDPSSNQPRDSRKREIAIKTVLAQNNELANKLRSVLELYLTTFRISRPE